MIAFAYNYTQHFHLWKKKCLLGIQGMRKFASHIWESYDHP